MEAPKGRRDEFVEPYFNRAKPDAVVVILKAREPARIMTAIGDSKTQPMASCDREPLGRPVQLLHQRPAVGTDVRAHLSLPSVLCARLSQSTPLARQPHARGRHRFRQLRNAFITCAAPDRLQALADALTPWDLLTCGQKWLARLTPFFTANEREHAGCQHRLFFSQVEFCDNLIFRRRAALDKLGERLLDANRTIGQPNKITVIFGRRITRHHRGKLQTEIEDMNLPNPVIRSHYGNGFIKQYVRDHLILRTEAASNNVNDYGVKKSVQNLPAAPQCPLGHQRQLSRCPAGHSRDLHRSRPTAQARGTNVHRWASEFPASSSTTRASSPSCTRSCASPTLPPATPSPPPKSTPQVIAALGCPAEHYSLASLRYDLSKLRAKGLVAKLPNSRRYQLLPQGYSICLVFLKLFERVYAPLTAGLLSPISADARFDPQKRSQLDRLYQRVVDDLDTLVRAVGLKAA